MVNSYWAQQIMQRGGHRFNFNEITVYFGKIPLVGKFNKLSENRFIKRESHFSVA